jgi:hypothetical protein
MCQGSGSSKGHRRSLSKYFLVGEVNIWSTMSYWQHLGIVIMGVMIGLSLRTLRQVRRRK